MVLEYEEKKYLFDYVADIFKGGFPKPGAQPGHFIGGAKLIGCGWIAEWSEANKAGVQGAEPPALEIC